MNNTVDQKISFNFTYYAMKLLGKNLYSNPWTAISEIVANGIDAGAPNVYVLVDMRNKAHATVEIFDDGSGMTYDDLCNKYTLIGRNKRETLDNIEGKTLGRKGIGKLAALYLSPQYYLVTKTRDESSCWSVDTTLFKDNDIPAMNSVEGTANFIIAKQYWESCATGTMIHLSNVNLAHIGEGRLKSLYAILSDYYLGNVINSKIQVCVLSNENEVISFKSIEKNICFETMCAIFDNTEDGYSKRLHSNVFLLKEEGVQEIDDIKIATKVLDPKNYSCEGTMQLENLAGEIDDVPYKLSGWIGIHSSLEKKVLERNASNSQRIQHHPNALRLYVRGKLAVNDFMTYVASSQAFASYIEGEISFDVLDDDRFEDASTSNREGYSSHDPRVKKLLEIVKKIVTSLISTRAEMGSTVNSQRDAYFEKLRLAEEKKKLEEEQKRLEAERQAELERLAKKEEEEKRKAAELKLDQARFDLGSEKRRNVFLNESLSQDQIIYSKRLHMLRINNSTIENIIRGLILQKKNGLFTIENAWQGVQEISYCNERNKSVLEYYALAEFDTKDEQVRGDLFEFFEEYCKTITRRVCVEEDRPIDIETKVNCTYVRTFVPQNIGVVIENVASNSYKNGASKIVFNMYENEQYFCIDIIDNGNGLNANADVNSLFEFGKSYTRFGTGVGLYHIKNIVTDMNGTIGVNVENETGFELNVRFKK